DSDSLMKEIDLFCTPDYLMPSGIKDKDCDSERNILIPKDLPSNDTLLFAEKESFHFDISLFSRPPAKPPDSDTGILNIKMMGDIYDQRAFMHKLMITLASEQSSLGCSFVPFLSPLIHSKFPKKDAFGNKQYKSEDIQELFCKLFNDVQNIHEELAEYINNPSWNRLAFYNNDEDDDEDYTTAITPDLLITALIMEDEHLDTIPEKESDEFIKSNVENLVLNPSESEDLCDI
nr:hypothetical protein [Tanacetum cinerariifolium]